MATPPSGLMLACVNRLLCLSYRAYTPPQFRLTGTGSSGRRSGEGDGHRALALARRRDGDFNVLPESGKEIDQSAHREIAGPVACQRRYMGLLDTEDFCGFRLSEAAVLDDASDLKRQPGLHQLLVRIGQAKVREHVTTSFDNTLRPGCLASRFHGHKYLSL